MPLSNRLSTNLLDKHRPATTAPKDHSPPPAYIANASEDANANPADITAAFSNLDLRASAVPTPDQCIAHLKLLEAFHQLREDVALHDGLYGIYDHFVSDKESEAQRTEILTQVREKRWAIYVAKAAKRFECWWTNCVEAGATKADWKNLPSVFARGPEVGSRFTFTKNDLPPLGWWNLSLPDEGAYKLIHS